MDWTRTDIKKRWNRYFKDQFNRGNSKADITEKLVSQGYSRPAFEEYLRDYKKSDDDRKRNFAVLSLFIILVGLFTFVFIFKPAIIGKLILRQHDGGTTYYVDSSNGDDSNDGHSPSNAIRTIRKVNSLNLNPNDKVLFKRGETWRFPQDAYLTLKNGNGEEFITYGAYGEGYKPEFLGSNYSDNPDDWTDLGDNIWRYNLKLNDDAGNLIYDNGRLFGQKNWSIQEIVNGGEGYYYYNTSNKYLYVYSTENPIIKYHNIEMSLKRTMIDINNKHNVIFENISIKYGGWHGIDGANSYNILIRENDISYIGGGYYAPGVRAGNGIQFWRKTNNVVVTGNRLWEIYDAALTVQASSGADYNASNETFTNNQIWNSAYCFEYFQADPESSVRNVMFDHNTCYNMGKGWYNPQRKNYMDGVCFRSGVKVDTNSANISFTNNVCHTTNEWTTDDFMVRFNDVWYDWQNTSVLKIDNNVYYNFGDKFALWGIYNWKTYYSFDEYKEATGKDNNSQIANPMFADADAIDFRPSSDSAACDSSTAGSYVGALPCSGQEMNYCGDGLCDIAEDCGNCVADCGECPGTCGDGTCGSGEDCNSCEEDCSSCPINTTISSCVLQNTAWNEDNHINDAYDLSNCFTDPLNSSLSYSLAGNHSIIVRISGNGKVNLTAPKDWSGSEKVTFTAASGERTASTNQITLTVNPLPDCGDTVCEQPETCSSCSADCGECKKTDNSQSGKGSSGSSGGFGGNKAPVKQNVTSGQQKKDNATENNKSLSTTANVLEKPSSEPGTSPISDKQDAQVEIPSTPPPKIKSIFAVPLLAFSMIIILLVILIYNARKNKPFNVGSISKQQAAHFNREADILVNQVLQNAAASEAAAALAVTIPQAVEPSLPVIQAPSSIPLLTEQTNNVIPSLQQQLMPIAKDNLAMQVPMNQEQRTDAPKEENLALQVTLEKQPQPETPIAETAKFDYKIDSEPLQGLLENVAPKDIIQPARESLKINEEILRADLDNLGEPMTLHNGLLVSSLDNLFWALPTLTNEDFTNHVNSDKHEFADWSMQFGQEISNLVKQSRTKEELYSLLRSIKNQQSIFRSANKT